MFDALARLLSEPARPAQPDLRLSVAVLLLEAARQDDHFDAAERAVITRLLAARFALGQGECERLMATAQNQANELVQLHGHTSAIAEAMTPQQRIELIEMLWGVAYADGVLDPEEDLLIRRIAGLVYVDDRERVLARQRVLARREAKNA